MVNSIRKGKSFERTIAKHLTQTTGCKWNRVPLSGGFSTRNNTTDARFDGDVFTEDEAYNDIVIECKNYNSLELNDLFNFKSKLYSWITQCINESKDKEWILFIKIKNKGEFFVVKKNYKHKLIFLLFNNNCLFFEDYIMVKIK